MAKEKVGDRMSDDEYNGWTNRETWAVMLHLDNDQGLYDEYHERFKNCCDRNKQSPKTLIWAFSDELREWVTEFLHISYWQEMGVDMPELVINMQDDIGSLWRVNWDEIARSIAEDIKNELEYTSTFNVEQEIKNGTK